MPARRFTDEPGKSYNRDQDLSAKELKIGDKVVFTGQIDECKRKAKELMTGPTHFTLWTQDGRFLCECRAEPGKTLLWTGRS